MKVRKILMLTMVLTLLFATAAFAESISQNVRVLVNKKEIDGGILVDNKAYLAVGTLAKSLQAFVTWDNDEKKVTISKPNVHMFTMNDNQAFQSVPKDRYKFHVHAQIDSMKTDISSLKFTITDPYGDETLIEARYAGDDNFPSDKEDFLLNTKDISYNFKYAGRYVVRCWMKAVGDSSMQVVSEKSIIIK
ncbi:stalk domain-containing protein [Cohnella candidum]|uniref:Copper amine oxidase n=1 Tax=Cohnella candidum TaxID=2674991 RepID=A0A3G3JUC6_9BACL|nr:stalk domain-containing protein [Cohnella candidum]AYQ71843.1 copper amine oxidase [Cohnella candidum]